ncbi:MAG: glycosyltransferase [Clostridia bacterium]|nr:glycosyltransferase [Clostridia bacterium]
MNLSVIIPSYNEAENLKNLIPKIKENLEQLKELEYEILIIDTMEKTDNTDEICAENSVNYFNRENGDNYGDAIRTGISKAKNDYLLIMDADGSHSPNELYKLINNCEKYDLTIGSRYIKDGKTENNFILIIMSWIVNIAYRMFLKVKVKDISNSLRVYKAEDIKKLKLETDNFDIVEEILVKLCLYNKDYKIREVPIVFEKRKNGKSKRKLGKFILSYIATMRKLTKMKKESKNKTKK